VVPLGSRIVICTSQFAANVPADVCTVNCSVARPMIVALSVVPPFAKVSVPAGPFGDNATCVTTANA
jgi:hypothetical protein